MNAQQMAEYVRKLVKEPDADRYDNAEIFMYLSEGGAVIADITEAIENTATIQVTAGTALASLPADCLRVKNLYLGSAKLSAEDSDNLTENAGSAAWRGEIGTPANFIPFGATRARLYPVPNSNVSMELDYVQSANHLVADGDVSTLPENLHYLQCRYAAWRILDLDESGKAPAEYEKFLRDAEIARINIKKRRPKVEGDVTRG